MASFWSFLTTSVEVGLVEMSARGLPSHLLTVTPRKERANLAAIVLFSENARRPWALIRMRVYVRSVTCLLIRAKLTVLGVYFAVKQPELLAL